MLGLEITVIKPDGALVSTGEGRRVYLLETPAGQFVAVARPPVEVSRDAAGGVWLGLSVDPQIAQVLRPLDGFTPVHAIGKGGKVLVGGKELTPAEAVVALRAGGVRGKLAFYACEADAFLREFAQLWPDQVAGSDLMVWISRGTGHAVGAKQLANSTTPRPDPATTRPLKVYPPDGGDPAALPGAAAPTPDEIATDPGPWEHRSGRPKRQAAEGITYRMRDSEDSEDSDEESSSEDSGDEDSGDEESEFGDDESEQSPVDDESEPSDVVMEDADGGSGFVRGGEGDFEQWVAEVAAESGDELGGELAKEFGDWGEGLGKPWSSLDVGESEADRWYLPGEEQLDVLADLGLVPRQTGATGNCFYLSVAGTLGAHLPANAQTSDGLRAEMAARFVADYQANPGWYQDYLSIGGDLADKMLGVRPPRRPPGGRLPGGWAATAHEVYDVISRDEAWNNDAGEFIPQIAARLFGLDIQVITTEAGAQGALPQEEGADRPVGRIVHVTYPTGHFLGTAPMGDTSLVGQPVTAATGRDGALAVLTAIQDQIAALDADLLERNGMDFAELARTGQDLIQLANPDADPLLVARRELANWIALANRLHGAITDGPDHDRDVNRFIVAVAAAQASHVQLTALQNADALDALDAGPTVESDATVASDSDAAESEASISSESTESESSGGEDGALMIRTKRVTFWAKTTAEQRAKVETAVRNMLDDGAPLVRTKLAADLFPNFTREPGMRRVEAVLEESHALHQGLTNAIRNALVEERSGEIDVDQVVRDVIQPKKISPWERAIVKRTLRRLTRQAQRLAQRAKSRNLPVVAADIARRVFGADDAQLVAFVQRAVSAADQQPTRTRSAGRRPKAASDDSSADERTLLTPEERATHLSKTSKEQLRQIESATRTAFQDNRPLERTKLANQVFKGLTQSNALRRLKAVLEESELVTQRITDGIRDALIERGSGRVEPDQIAYDVFPVAGGDKMSNWEPAMVRRVLRGLRQEARRLAQDAQRRRRQVSPTGIAQQLFGADHAALVKFVKKAIASAPTPSKQETKPENLADLEVSEDSDAHTQGSKLLSKAERRRTLARLPRNDRKEIDNKIENALDSKVWFSRDKLRDEMFGTGGRNAVNAAIESSKLVRDRIAAEIDANPESPNGVIAQKIFKRSYPWERQLVEEVRKERASGKVADATDDAPVRSREEVLAEWLNKALELARRRYRDGEPIIPIDLAREVGYPHPGNLVKRIEAELSKHGLPFIRRPATSARHWDELVWRGARSHWDHGPISDARIRELIKELYPKISTVGEMTRKAKEVKELFGKCGYLSLWPADRPRTGSGPGPMPYRPSQSSRLTKPILAHMRRLAKKWVGIGKPIESHSIGWAAGYQGAFEGGDLRRIEYALEKWGHQHTRRHGPADERWDRVMRRGGRIVARGHLLTPEMIEDLVVSVYRVQRPSELLRLVRSITASFQDLGWLAPSDEAESDAPESVSSSSSSSPSSSSPGPPDVRGKRRAPSGRDGRKRPRVEPESSGSGSGEGAGSPMVVDTVVGTTAAPAARRGVAGVVPAAWEVTFTDDGAPVVTGVEVPPSAAPVSTRVDLRGVRPVTGTQVGWGDTDLSRAVVAVRAARGYHGHGNGAALEYRGSDGQWHIEVGFSQRFGSPGHAERRLWASLAARGIRPDQVTRVYSELQPCRLPFSNCAKFLAKLFPKAAVTWSFPYPLDQEKRLAGVQQFQQAVNGRFGGKRPAPSRQRVTPSRGSGLAVGGSGRQQGQVVVPPPGPVASTELTARLGTSLPAGMRLFADVGSVIDVRVDGIVNAANGSLLGAGGGERGDPARGRAGDAGRAERRPAAARLG
jgi:hypothetical protein